MSKDVRLANLRQLLEERFEGKIALLAKELDKSTTQVGHWFNPPEKPYRPIGERLAREIEATLHLGRGALDVPGMVSAQTLPGDEIKFLRDYRRARPSWKFVLQHLARLEPALQEAAAARVNELLAELQAGETAYTRTPGAVVGTVHEPAPYSDKFTKQTTARRDKTTGKK